MSTIGIGSPVICLDGIHAGEVERVVLDPRTGRVTHLVLRPKDTRDLLVPVELVQDVSERGVTLASRFLDLETMPEYVETDFVAPRAEETPVGPYHHGQVLFAVQRVRRRAGPCVLPLGKPVQCRDGLCGTVDEALLDPITGAVLGFRLIPSAALTRDVVVPAEWVLDTRGDRLILACSVRQLEDLLPSEPIERAAS